jgi:hypothetical protein
MIAPADPPMTTALLTLEKRPFDLSQIPLPPRRPSPRAQALLFRFQVADRVRLFVGGLFVASTIVLGVAVARGLLADVLLDLGIGRIKVTGKVVNQADVAGPIDSENHPALIEYTYAVHGVTYTHRYNALRRSLPMGMKIGSTLDLEVVSFKPRWARITGTRRAYFGYGPLFLLPLPFIGVALIVSAVRARKGAIRAFLYGTPVLASALLLGRDQAQANRPERPFKFEWEFSLNGQRYSGRLSMLPMDVREILQYERIPVLYDPEDPSRNVPYLP